MTIEKKFLRGLLLPCEIGVHTDGFSIGGTPDPMHDERARFAALYFDLCKYSGCDFLGYNNPISESLKILQERKFLSVGNADGIQIIDVNNINGTNERLDQYILRKNRENLSPKADRWSILYNDQNDDFDHNSNGNFNAVIVSLFEKLPIPRPEVTVDSVLDFNKKHRRELINLRSGLQKFAERLSSAQGKNDVATSIRDEIEINYENLSESLDKQKIPFVTRCVDIGLKVPSNILEGFLTRVGLEKDIANTISNSVDISFKRKRVDFPSSVDFSYVIKASSKMELQR